MTVDSIYVENYRGFSIPTNLELKPITILIGRNSSGKSSLIRLIPLLQQSLDKRGSVPILWDSELVDMGSIADVLSQGGQEARMTIGFSLNTDVDHFLSPARYYDEAHAPKESTINYKAHLGNRDGKTAFNSLELELYGIRLELRWNDAGLLTDILHDGSAIDLQSVSYQVDSSNLFPLVTRIYGDGEIKSRRRRIAYFPPLDRELNQIFHGKTSDIKIEILKRRVWFQERAEFEESIRALPHIVPRKITPDILERIRLYTFIRDLTDIITILEDEITSCFKNSAYIGPARARSERFSRIQELSVERLAAGGENTAMYLHSLNDDELSSFNDLMMLAAGHKVSIEKSGPSHVSMRVGTGVGVMENVNDIGFGFSQIIPVVAQLHAVMERPVSREHRPASEAIYAVEQPELHLHPAMQGNLANLFVEIANRSRDRSVSLKILAETHSENLIAQLGRLVAGGKIAREDVGIVFVEKDSNSNISKIRNMSFDEDGFIPEWPLGFFSS